MSEEETERTDGASPRGGGPPALALSPAVAESVLRSLSTGIVVQGRSGEIQFCNAAAERILGLSRDQVIGRVSLDASWKAVREDGSPLPVEDHPATVALRTGASVRGFVMGLRAPDGSRHWVSVDSEPVRGPDGTLEAVSTAYTDLSEGSGAAAALRQSEERARNLFEHAPVGIFHSVPGGRLLDTNPALARMLGYSSPDELVGAIDDMTRQLYVEPEVRPRIMADLLASDEWVHYDEVAWRRKDGGLITVDMTGRKVVDAAGRLVCLEGFIEDVTEKRRALEELRSAKVRYDELVRRIPVGIHTCRLGAGGSLRVEYSSERTRRMLGLPDREPLDAEAVLAAVLPEDRASLEETNRRAARTLDPVRWEGRCLVGGGTRWIRIESEPTALPHGESLWNGVVIDITERRQADAEVQRLNAELEARVLARTADLTEANRELEAFSYAVSHELRTPLRAIDGFVALIAGEVGERLDDEGRRRFSQVRWNAQRMGQLIDDLLAFSQAGRASLRIGAVDMTRAARSAFARVVPDPALAARVSFSLDDLPPATGDPELLARVWENLLSNAAKFSAGRDAPCVTVTATREETETIYRVRDNGVGFEAKYADKLFGVFQRLHGIHEFEGTGVGLALVRRIVVRHGGRVWADGEPGRGATLSFSLPSAPASRAP